MEVEEIATCQQEVVETLCHKVLQKPDTSSRIPPLCRKDNTWAMDEQEKADTFAACFCDKWILPVMEYVEDGTYIGDAIDYFVLVRPNLSRKFLKDIDPDSGVGPDDIPSIVLKRMFMVLELPITKIVRKIISSGAWPDLWKLHWVLPLFKKGLTSNPHHYRGIHFTSHVSKVVERVLAAIFITPFVKTLSLFGENQFAYTKERGAREELAFFVFYCLFAFSRSQKVAFHQGDVAGAFDKVDSNILLRKCRTVGLHPKFLKLLHSWLRGRSASVITGGKKTTFFPNVEYGFSGHSLRTIVLEFIFQGR